MIATVVVLGVVVEYAQLDVQTVAAELVAEVVREAVLVVAVAHVPIQVVAVVGSFIM